MNRFYAALPGAVQASFERLAAATGRRYGLFDYYGHPEAERVIVAMGSAIETLAETADWLAARGEKVGVVAVRLFLPLSTCPPSCRRCRRPSRRSPCSIAPRSRAASASRCT